MPRALETFAFIATLLVSGGVLGALVGAIVQRKIDREKLVTEWKHKLREGILRPRLDAALQIYNTLISGAVPDIADVMSLCANEAEMLLTDLAPSAVKLIQSLPHRVGQYEADRHTVRDRSHLVFDDETRFDAWFRGETFRGADYYRHELAVLWDRSQEGSDARRVEEVGFHSEVREWYEELQQNLCYGLEIRHELISSLQEFIAAIKAALLRTS